MPDTKHGVIYILTSPAFPDYIKLGYADDLERRLAQLNRSECLPYAFRAYAVYETPTRITDLKLHDLIDKLNPDLRTVEEFDGKVRKREFYAMSAEEAFSLLSCIAQISGTADRLHRMEPEGHEIKDIQAAEEVTAKSRRGVFRFSMVNLKPGDEVYFTEDPSVVATIVDDRHISYAGQVTSLSRLAQDLKGYVHAPQGPAFFAAQGHTENLDTMRSNLESEV